MLACQDGNEILEGRWLSPDPLGGDIANPQSLNRYAYALNNPTTLTDPAGLGECTWDASTNTLNCPLPPDVNFFVFDVSGGGCTIEPYLCESNYYFQLVSLASRSGAGTLAPPPKPAPASISSITRRIACAANFGDTHSLAAALGVQKSFWGQLYLGNTASAITHLGVSVVSANGGLSAGQVGNILLTGARQGIPGGGPGGQGVAGQAHNAFLTAGVSTVYNTITGVGAEPIELGITASGKVASVAVPLSEASVGAISSVVTGAKFGLDVATFLVGVAECGN